MTHRSIRTRLTSSYLLLVLLYLVCVAVFVTWRLQVQYTETYGRVIVTQARLIARMLEEYAEDGGAGPARLDPEYFLLAHKFDRFVTVETPAQVQALEKLAGLSITKLTDLRRALEKMFAAEMEVGMVTVKSTIAYSRELLFQEVSEHEAEQTFERVLRGEIQVAQGFRHAVERL